MSKNIKFLFPNATIEGNKNPPRSGAFEMTLNGKLVYSKFQTNNFPSKDELEKILHD